jgi:hypothetical protein
MSVCGTPGQDAEHLVEQVRRDQRGVAGRVVGRRDLDEVAADEVQPRAAPHDLERLPGAEAAGLHRAGAGREGGVEAVDVEAEVDRRIADPARTCSISGVSERCQHSSACTTVQPLSRPQSKSSGA